MNTQEIKEQAHKDFSEIEVSLTDDIQDDIKSLLDSLIDRTVQMTEERIVGIIKEIDTPVFEGATGFTYNSGWNDGEKSGQYHLKEEILSLITNKSDINKLTE